MGLGRQIYAYGLISISPKIPGSLREYELSPESSFSFIESLPSESNLWARPVLVKTSEAINPRSLSPELADLQFGKGYLKRAIKSRDKRPGLLRSNQPTVHCLHKTSFFRLCSALSP